MVISTIALICLLLDFAACDCRYPTTSDIKNVIFYALRSDENPSPNVEIDKFHVVCLANSRQRDRYRYVSAVVKYICKGSSDCPTQSPAVEQFESQCNSEAWNHTVAFLTKYTRTLNPVANFSTTVNNCAFCFSQELIDAVPFPFYADTTTHCVGELG